MCNDKNIKELLHAFQKLELDQNDAKRVLAHLAGCNDCRTELSLLSLMPDRTVPDPGEAFWNAMPIRVSEAVQDNQKSGKSPLGLFRIRRRFILPARTYAAAAAATVLVLSWILISPGRLQNQPPAPADYAYHEYAVNPVFALHELSPAQLRSVDGWAAHELSRIASEAALSNLINFDHDLSEDLEELSSHEMERLSGFLKIYFKEEVS